VNEQRIERAMAVVLLAGVTASAALIAIGLLGSFASGWSGSLIGVQVQARAPTDLANLADRLGALQPLAIAQLGTLVLIATPLIRVGVSAVGFAAEGDRLYVALALLVLAMLLLSLVALR
jgi:uncharacterized membrane protein